jgi:hypothetical protein
MGALVKNANDSGEVVSGPFRHREVALLGVAAEIGGHERTHRLDAETARSNVVERAADELTADPLPFRRGFDLCMHKHDHTRPCPVPDFADDLAVAENLVTALVRIVPHDVLVSHQP